MLLSKTIFKKKFTSIINTYFEHGTFSSVRRSGLWGIKLKWPNNIKKSKKVLILTSKAFNFFFTYIQVKHWVPLVVSVFENKIIKIFSYYGTCNSSPLRPCNYTYPWGNNFNKFKSTLSEDAWKASSAFCQIGFWK